MAATHPGLANCQLAAVRQPVIGKLKDCARQHRADVCSVDDRSLLFAIPALRSLCAVVFDCGDSCVLYGLREFRTRLATRRLGGLSRFLLGFKANLFDEWYYGRRSDLNIAVSPVDKLWLDRINGSSAKNRLVLNGVRPGSRENVSKIPGRLIFTGAMDFPPNYDSALWFLDKVFPRTATAL